MNKNNTTDHLMGNEKSKQNMITPIIISNTINSINAPKMNNKNKNNNKYYLLPTSTSTKTTLNDVITVNATKVNSSVSQSINCVQSAKLPSKSTKNTSKVKSSFNKSSIKISKKFSTVKVLPKKSETNVAFHKSNL